MYGGVQLLDGVLLNWAATSPTCWKAIVNVIAESDEPPWGNRVLISSRPLIDESSAVRLLAAGGTLKPEELADSRLRVTDLSRRCRCLLVRLGEAGWVIKQGTSAETEESVRQEAEVYRALQTTAFAKSMPPFLAYEEERGVLVTGYVVGETPRELYTAESSRRVSAAVGIGVALARLHRIESDCGLPPKQPPPILRCGYPTVDSIEFHSPASLEVIRLIQSSDTLMSLLDTVRAQWVPEAMSHNDLRGDNIIIRASGEPIFVDWEMGGPADRRWDVAGLLAERLVWWLTDPDCWVPWANETSSKSPNEAAVTGMRAIKEFAHAFLGGYVVNYAGALDLSRAKLPGLMTWCAARLLQFALEYTHQRTGPQVTSRQLLQVAANIHLNPGMAARTFFGLALDDDD